MPSFDPLTSLKAVDMGLKLHDACPASKSLHVTAIVECPVDASRYAMPKTIEVTTEDGVD